MQKMQTPGKPDCTHLNLCFLCFSGPHFLGGICVGCSRAAIISGSFLNIPTPIL